MFPSIYQNILNKLLIKTKHEELPWYEAGNNGEIILRYGDFITKISRLGDTFYSDYQVKVDNIRGNIDLFIIKNGEEHYNEVGDLYIEALRQARDVKHLVEKIEHTFD